MKKIIPFKKEILFKTNISEITSISLEHQLSINNLDVVGEFIISGEYKVSDNSKTVEPFNYNIPFENILEDKYDTVKAEVDIDDFYYEIINDKVLAISIDVCVDKLNEILIPQELPLVDEKKDIIEELYEEQNKQDDYDRIDETILEKKERCIEEDDIIPGEEEIKEGDDVMPKDINNTYEGRNDMDNSDVKDKINSLFSNISNDDIYVSYNVYIVREGDTLESIINKYQVSEEQLKDYNDLKELKLGDKLIIPINK